jgi:hypothetical protein
VSPLGCFMDPPCRPLPSSRADKSRISAFPRGRVRSTDPVHLVHGKSLNFVPSQRPLSSPLPSSLHCHHGHIAQPCRPSRASRARSSYTSRTKSRIELREGSSYARSSPTGITCSHSRRRRAGTRVGDGSPSSSVSSKRSSRRSERRRRAMLRLKVGQSRRFLQSSFHEGTMALIVVMVQSS